MTFFQSISTCFSKYATFTGRASRSEYWWWTLFVTLITGVFYIPLIYSSNGDSLGYNFAPGFIGLVLFLPSLAVGIRRLHDTGRSGWNYLWGLLPFIGTIILIAFFLTPSQPFENRFGYPDNRSRF